MNNYTHSSSMIEKVTVTISRKQLWDNYSHYWAEHAWTEYFGVEELKRVADVLLSGEDFSHQTFSAKFRELFRKGYTPFLLGDAMDLIDPRDKEIAREIIVTDEDKELGDTKLIIKDHDITF